MSLKKKKRVQAIFVFHGIGRGGGGVNHFCPIKDSDFPKSHIQVFIQSVAIYIVRTFVAADKMC